MENKTKAQVRPWNFPQIIWPVSNRTGIQIIVSVFKDYALDYYAYFSGFHKNPINWSPLIIKSNCDIFSKIRLVTLMVN